MFMTDLPNPENLNVKIVEEKKVQTNAKHQFAYIKSGILAGIRIIKIPKKDEKKPTYSELSISQKDKEKIDDVITSVGMHSKTTLLLDHYNRLMKLGDEIRHIHPFRFLGYIFNKPDLKHYMALTFDDYWKRKKWVHDFANTMEIRDLRKELKIYVNEFAQEVHISPEIINFYLDKRDWEGLVKMLIKQ